MTSYAIFIAFFQSAKLWKQTRLNKSSLLPEQTLHADSAETYCVSLRLALTISNLNSQSWKCSIRKVIRCGDIVSESLRRRASVNCRVVAASKFFFISSRMSSRDSSLAWIINSR